ncbi:MAG TPA: lipocalin family protein [Flavobacteriaceae bacterium]|nr:lipocalin family protein [Flavobacteriaceae bacterium]
MKTFRIILVLFLVTFITSCSKDDAPSEPSLAGEWKLTEGKIENGSIVVQMDGFPIPVTVNVTGHFAEIGDGNRLHLNGDQTYHYESDTLIVELTLSFLGSNEAQQFPIENFLQDGTWENQDNKLILKDAEGVAVPYSIVSLTDATLELTANIKEMDLPLELGDMVQSIDMNLRVKFSRIP